MSKRRRADDEESSPSELSSSEESDDEAKAFNEAVDRGMAAMGDESWGGAIDAFAEALKLDGGRSADCAYNLACCHASRGEIGAALQWLRSAAEWGVRDVQPARDEQLSNLRGVAEFERLAKELARSSAGGARGAGADGDPGDGGGGGARAFAPAPAAVLSRERRSGGGARMAALMGEEKEKDDAFWGHDTWADDEQADEEYSGEEEKPDYFDSDFNDTESDDDDDDDGEGGGKGRKARGGGGRRRELDDDDGEGARAKGRGRAYHEPKRASAARAPMTAEERVAARKAAKARQAALAALGTSRGRRDTTQAKTQSSAADRARVDEAMQASRRAQAPRVKPKSDFTQEELLLEAAKTEQANVQWLEEQRAAAAAYARSSSSRAGGGSGMKLRPSLLSLALPLSRYALKHARAKSAFAPAHTLQCRLVSRRADAGGASATTLTFPKVDDVPPMLRRRDAPLVPAHLRAGGGGSPRGAGAGAAAAAAPRCAVTGRPAKYRDALTGEPYADADAFRELRRRYGAETRSRAAVAQQAALAFARARQVAL